MNILILGAGGVGGYFGARLLQSGHTVAFVARGAHLEALQTEGLHVKHPSFEFAEKIKAFDLQSLADMDAASFDLIILTTKSTATREIAIQLALWLRNQMNPPYILSLQNGVENEAILGDYFAEEYIIGGLTRKIGAHVVKPAHIEAIGTAETILGMMHVSMDNERFLEELALAFKHAGIPTQTTHDIKQELWKKLVINNGVNALCALLRVKTGALFDKSSLSEVVQGLMQETAHAARSLHVKISQEDVDAMFELIKQFDSIKPSMLVDLEQGRALEIEEICGVVIRALHQIGVDAPYTKTIKALLEFNMEQ
ncbi:ketopantoate reductase family protein [Sulfurospirillum arsenophilum]|uniref:ketopantoate reductase family protein n=1 Tax=Sulfurospirillum arsenophilum TaxID=56698 RepID=UPI0005A99F9D|nr:2-dehydropantoate 2-reductase [Sulfurospirillum arsenophilum]